MTNIASVMTFSKLRLLVLIGICWASAVQAEFGTYVSHSVDLQTLVIETDKGELQITSIDDAAFEVHYRENDRQQLPSFALSGPPPQIRSTFAETDTTLEFSAPGLTAIIQKSPLRIDYVRNGDGLLSEEAGYVSSDNAVGFRFSLDDDEKIASCQSLVETVEALLAFGLGIPVSVAVQAAVDINDRVRPGFPRQIAMGVTIAMGFGVPPVL